MGAEGFHGRVRDGIGCLAPRYGHQAGEAPFGCEVRREVSREVSGVAWACPWLEQGLGAARGRWCGAGGFRAAGLRLSPRCNELHRPAPMDQADPSD